MRRDIVFATSNQGKLNEVKKIGDSLGLNFFGLADFVSIFGEPPEVEESGETYSQNALLKATVYSSWCKKIVIADDTGLEVMSLKGEPGIRSARYAGEGASSLENAELLLKNLRSELNRKAKFVCELALITPDGKSKFSRGEIQGEILQTRAGSGGFGYDPLFLVTELGMSLAEIKEREVPFQTHREIALRKLIEDFT